MLEITERLNLSNLKDEIILQSSRISQANSDSLLGVSSYSNSTLILNNVKRALLKILNELEKIIANKNEPSINHSLEVEEIKKFLLLFERAVFDAPINSEDPTKMFESIQKVRLQLQIGGASLITNQEAADNFKDIRKELLLIENEVIKKYPEVVMFIDVIKKKAADGTISSGIHERRQMVQSFLGNEKYAGSVNLMMSVRRLVIPKVERIKEIYRSLLS